jgi:ABC-2 type transport system permease protein
MSAFWTTRINAINQVYFVIFLFFSGRLAPLDLLPSFAQTLATLLPFRWMLSFPLELLLGLLSTQEILTGYAMQLGWTAVVVALMLLAWRSGVRQFSAVGT